MESIDTVAGLRAVYRQPSQPSIDKEIDHIDEHCRDFIAHAPFVVMATSTHDGSRVDVSPKGGTPGFVSVIDERHVAIPDMSGNNRLDSIRNIVEGGTIALLFMVPGIEETLRVNGSAVVTTDPAILEASLIVGKRPNVCIHVTVRAAFIHCAKALKRSRLWNPEEWPVTDDMATPACMLRDHIGLDMTVEQSQARLDKSYETTTWEVAGTPLA